jgi:hypothetical protein
MNSKIETKLVFSDYTLSNKPLLRKAMYSQRFVKEVGKPLCARASLAPMRVGGISIFWTLHRPIKAATTETDAASSGSIVKPAYWKIPELRGHQAQGSACFGASGRHSTLILIGSRAF